MSKFLTCLLASCLIVISMCLAASAQSSSATLSGTVIDENNAVIPGTGITVQNRATSLERHATTNESGSFTIPLLPPGEYTVLVEREGFTRVQLTNIVLNVGDQKAVQVQLKVGDVASTVEVRPDETLVNTSPAVTNTIDRTFVQNLPLNGRSFQSLILLTPGVTVAPAGANRPGLFSVNGQRANTNVFTVDGVSANTGVFNNAGGTFGISQTLSGSTPGLTANGGTNGLVSVDALEEFKIQTSTYSAEYGRQPGGQITLVTRSGKNQFQGSLFEYFRNEKLDANDWFANSKGLGRSPLRQNIFGGTLGGPVFLPNVGDGGPSLYKGRDRTFFFFSYEGIRLTLPQARTANLPSVRLRNRATPTLRPVLNAFPIPTGPEILTNTPCPVPPAPPNPACDTSTNRLFSGFSPFTGAYSDPSNADIAGLRIDHSFNDKLTLFGRYNYALSDSSTRNSNMVFVQDATIKTETATFGATWAAKSNISNELRFNITNDESLQAIRLDNFGGAVPIDLSATVTDLSSKGSLVQSSVFLSLPSGTATLQYGASSGGTTQRQLNIVDNVTWLKGTHTFKLGIDYRRLSPTNSPINYAQSLFFTSETQIESGLTATGSSITVRQTAKPVFTNISVYGQDTWKLSQHLTLDLGIRWEINPPPGGDGKKLPAILGMDNLPTATLAPAGTPIYKTQYTAFAPRIGIAYQMSDVKGWERVIRGGFGVYYDVGSGLAGYGLTLFPFQVSKNIAGNTFPLSATVATPPPFPTVIALPITSGVAAFAPDFNMPYTLQWNASVEQSLGENQTLSASYVAAAGRRLILTVNLNQLPPGGQRPNPNFTAMDYVSNAPSSDYHSLQVQFRRRLTRGLQALANYTWSHAIDEVSEDARSFVLERGNADFDVRHNFSAAITYNLPGRGFKGLIGDILGNWSVDGIVHAQSALPVNLFAGSFIGEDGTSFSVRPDLVPGQPLYIYDPIVAGSPVAGGRKFNPAAFRDFRAVPGTGPFLRQGTLGRNVLRGLPLYQVDLGIRRQFTLAERLNLQLKAEAFNIFNHPNFGGFGSSISTPDTLGVPNQMLGRSLGGLNALYQIGGPRSLQFSLRIGF